LPFAPPTYWMARATLRSTVRSMIDGEKIKAVGSGITIPPHTKLIDLGGLTLLPGLIDVHTHLLSEMDGTNVTLQDVEMLKIVATQSTAKRAADLLQGQ
jgi:imidazolonepropionase-like amidohydrolase